ncbi:MAG: SpoIIE family protein phosphatase [Bacteroidetes bacterium]|nr:SpoIIE family protein phosphatase [Bacteroidota bacterium]
MSVGVVAQHTADSLLKLANVLYASQPDTSYAISKRAELLALKSGDRASLAEAYLCQGRYMLLKSSLDDANKIFNAALEIYNATNDLSGKAHIYSLKANIQNRIHNGEEAMALMQGSIELYQKARDTSGLITAMLNASLYDMTYNKYDEAEKTLNNLETYFPSMQESTRYYFYQNKGSLFLAQGKADKAITQYMNALDVARNLKMIDSEATILMKLGEAYRLNQDITNARKYLFQSEQVCLTNKLDHELVETYEEIIQLYQQTGDYAMAYNYLKIKTELKDKIINIEKINRISELEKRLALTEKQKELDGEKLNVQKAKLQSQRLLYFIFMIGAVTVLIVFLFVRTRALKNKIEEKSIIIEEKQKEILDSIHYAKRIQDTLLANRNIISESVNDYFILFKPKDIVSGDFYWATRRDDTLFLAVCDSTGHGVPGAFMSLLNINFLNEAINEKEMQAPHEVFNWIRHRLIDNMSQHDQKDGMDGVLVKMDRLKNNISYASAYNAPVLISNGELVKLPSDKMPVGKGEKTEDFNTYEFPVKKGDCIYLFTDGYADQFGGPKGKKFKYKQLEELLLEIHRKPFAEQQEILNQRFESWRGNLEQVDDVLITGIKW